MNCHYLVWQITYVAGSWFLEFHHSLVVVKHFLMKARICRHWQHTRTAGGRKTQNQIILKDFSEDHRNLQSSQCLPKSGYSWKQAPWGASLFLLDLDPADTKRELQEERTALLWRLGGTGQPSQDAPGAQVWLCLALPAAELQLAVVIIQLLEHQKHGSSKAMRRCKICWAKHLPDSVRDSWQLSHRPNTLRRGTKSPLICWQSRSFVRWCGLRSQKLVGLSPSGRWPSTTPVVLALGDSLCQGKQDTWPQNKVKSSSKCQARQDLTSAPSDCARQVRIQPLKQQPQTSGVADSWGSCPHIFS